MNVYIVLREHIFNSELMSTIISKVFYDRASAEDYVLRVAGVARVNDAAFLPNGHSTGVTYRVEVEEISGEQPE